MAKRKPCAEITADGELVIRGKRLIQRLGKLAGEHSDAAQLADWVLTMYTRKCVAMLEKPMRADETLYIQRDLRHESNAKPQADAQTA